MVGGSNQDLSKYLINFNAADWANRANAHLQAALGSGLQQSGAYGQQAVNAIQGYDQKAQQQMQQGFNQAQALNAPMRNAAYNALDAYQDSLGLPRTANTGLLSPIPNQTQGQ